MINILRDQIKELERLLELKTIRILELEKQLSTPSVFNFQSQSQYKCFHCHSSYCAGCGSAGGLNG
jgi:hypothetical protein